MPRVSVSVFACPASILHLPSLASPGMTTGNLNLSTKTQMGGKQGMPSATCLYAGRIVTESAWPV